MVYTRSGRHMREVMKTNKQPNPIPGVGGHWPISPTMVTDRRYPPSYVAYNDNRGLPCTVDCGRQWLSVHTPGRQNGHRRVYFPPRSLSKQHTLLLSQLFRVWRGDGNYCINERHLHLPSSPLVGGWSGASSVEPS